MTEIRMFDTGATRDQVEGKLCYAGFLSPIVLKRFAEYMHQHRLQSDGSMRSPDNWQKGMPKDAYMKSCWRHFVDLWFLHRGYERFDKRDGHPLTVVEVCCAIFFNVQGYAHEDLKENR